MIKILESVAIGALAVWLKFSGILENIVLSFFRKHIDWIPYILGVIIVVSLIDCAYAWFKGKKGSEKISARYAKNKVYEILRLTSDDKATLNVILRRILREDEQQEKEFAKQSREYWMYIWKIVYIIQRYYAERGYLEYAYSALLEEKSMFDIFSENNLITAVSIALGILGIIGGQTNIDIAYISLMLIILIVLIENVKAVFENNKPEKKEKKFYREIIEGVLNASKK